MELKMVGTLINQAMNLMELIPWSDEEGTVNIYPGVDEELQAAYEHLDEAMGVLKSPLAEIKELERVAVNNTVEQLMNEVNGE